MLQLEAQLLAARQVKFNVYAGVVHLEILNDGCQNVGERRSGEYGYGPGLQEPLCIPRPTSRGTEEQHGG